MTEPRIYIATPLHDGTVHHSYLAGALNAMSHFAGRIRMDAQIGSWLPRSRDILTSRFLESGCTHMMCIDSDIGWMPADIQTLLDTGKEFISGTYCKKQTERRIPAMPIHTDGDVIPCEHVPGGFLLVKRETVEAMAREYSGLGYQSDGRLLHGLWWPAAPYDGEDVAFCRKWRVMGGDIWLHTKVRLKHAGSFSYEPPEELSY